MRAETHIQRNQVLFTSLITLGGSLLFLVPNFPFHIGFCVIALVSSVFHLCLALFFDHLAPGHWTIANVFNIILLGFSIHFTGGILSPYNIVFFLILISGAGYGIRYPEALAMAIGTYLFVIVAEYFGILKPLDIRPADIYGNWPAMLVVAGGTIGLMMVSGSIYKITVRNLLANLQREHNLKQSMLRQLASLEAPSQLGLLVNKVVHDIRGPLGAVAGFINMLERENPLNEESKKDCSLMISELTRISNLANRLVLYLKPSGLESQNLCPKELLENVLAVLSFLPQAKRVRIERHFPAANDLRIAGDKEGLQQVYFNILKNAVEALEKSPDRRIDVRIADRDGYALVEIADSGPGIQKETLARLGRESLSTKKEGGGVGLMIAREIVESQDGRLEIESLVGVGTRVRTWLPLVRSAD